MQQQTLSLPKLPTTTIGSFPQTQALRQVRRCFKQGDINRKAYLEVIKNEVRQNIQTQEEIGLDVLVHGEPERTDMVEFFAEYLDGVLTTEHGWVQSYGSRCVKPPVIYGDIKRKQSMTTELLQYAQSLTDKPVKGMLTGPVTILCWSFVREDQAKSVTANQLALALREEIHDLEQVGIAIIQVDEAAFREGLPLRKQAQKDYFDWATSAFRLATAGVKDETQIHTHMCYSEFKQIAQAINLLDVDVISLESARASEDIGQIFGGHQLPVALGPGVYDIHSPEIPSTAAMKQKLEGNLKTVPESQLWINPDCGLKTRTWDEVIPALNNMVKAAHELRH